MKGKCGEVKKAGKDEVREIIGRNNAEKREGETRGETRG